MTVSTASYPFSVAPMIDWTDRHCRYFHRLLAPHAPLYTEMITAAALEHGDAARLLAFDAAEHPVILQLGGSDPRQMASAARRGAAAGFDEININVGCPSDRVQSGRFGACLMAEPALVRDCFEAMRAAVAVPVTVKTRLGIDDHDSLEFLLALIEPLVAAGLGTLVLHARIAILSGLSPKQNRTIPPLNYERVYTIKQRFPDLCVVLNGGVQSIADVHRHRAHVDAVMLGREAYNNPYRLAELSAEFEPATTLPSRIDVLQRYRPYAEQQLARGVRLHHMTRHLTGLFNGIAGGRRWRRLLSEGAAARDADWRVVETAAAAVQDSAGANSSVAEVG
ncbi:MAG: tRNA dihydrouridine(20/20a) synthase DusA [Pseudomonadota bacterium]